MCFVLYVNNFANYVNFNFKQSILTQVVKESNFESIISSTNSLVDIYVVMESVYSTTAAAALSVPNEAITLVRTYVQCNYHLCEHNTVQPGFFFMYTQ